MCVGFDSLCYPRRVAERNVGGLVLLITRCRDDRVRWGQRHLVSAAGNMDPMATQPK